MILAGVVVIAHITLRRINSCLCLDVYVFSRGPTFEFEVVSRICASTVFTLSDVNFSFLVWAFDLDVDVGVLFKWCLVAAGT